MPVLPTPDYLPSFPFRSGNLATLYPPLFRPTPKMPPPIVERIGTPDGDFLDLDKYAGKNAKSRRLAIISHGLEGNSKKKYVLGVARVTTAMGYDTICWNQRGCSPQPNLLPRSYHSGETNDLHTVLTHALASKTYDKAILIGFSMGGNQILKYLGEAPDRVPSEVVTAITFSVPVDLDATELVIAKPSRRVYFEYFMRGLRDKVRQKAKAFPDIIDARLLDGVHTLRAFDDRYTAPTNGYIDAADYYAHASSKQFLHNIKVPTLLVNALDDPFMAPECYPVREAESHPNLMLEMPKHGGHVGFVTSDPHNMYWSENRIKLHLRTI